LSIYQLSLVDHNAFRIYCPTLPLWQHQVKNLSLLHPTRSTVQPNEFIRPWLPPPWTTTDDRIRDGSSQSYLSSLASNGALFHGNLDIKTLGGAGFASQFSPDDAPPNKSSNDGGSYWDLSVYDGIEVGVGEGDGKIYTLILKDEPLPGNREDGREKAGISWEVEFKAGEEGEKFWVPWSDFKATYRGKQKKDAGELKTRNVCRVGVMMRR